MRVKTETITAALAAVISEWEFKYPFQRRTQKKALQLLVTCKLCKKTHWVFWKFLKSGRSKRCKICSDAPSAAKLMAIKKKYNALWTPTEVNKMQTDKDGVRRRVVWMVCHCGRRQWVRYNLFSVGDALSCRPCSKMVNPGMGGSHHPVRKAWYRLTNKNRLPKGGVQWKSWEDFKAWTIESGYIDGAKFKKKASYRTAKGICYSPETCHWDTSSVRNGANTVRQNNY